VLLDNFHIKLLDFLTEHDFVNMYIVYTNYCLLNTANLYSLFRLVSVKGIGLEHTDAGTGSIKLVKYIAVLFLK
jgi:hypothetical protein